VVVEQEDADPIGHGAQYTSGGARGQRT
jgi:hypothetical protein